MKLHIFTYIHTYTGVKSPKEKKNKEVNLNQGGSDKMATFQNETLAPSRYN